jgi:hypothetical protein
MVKKIFYTIAFTLLFNNLFSQAFVKGYSFVCGSAKSEDKNPSFTGFNADYFIKYKLSKRIYFKSNVGVGTYWSRSIGSSASVYDNQTGDFVTLRGPKAKSSNFAISVGAGLDYKIKNLIFGFNVLWLPSLKGSNQDELYTWKNNIAQEMYYDNQWGGQYYKYDVIGFSNAFTNKLSSVGYSFDIEYTFKKYGLKYSFLAASERPINQFGITYNLKYDWREVPE